MLPRSRAGKFQQKPAFPGKHHLARFNVIETGKDYHVDFLSDDGIMIGMAGSITFDNALLMTKIEHEWHSVADK